jgi:hypothetical protein
VILRLGCELDCEVSPRRFPLPSYDVESVQAWLYVHYLGMEVKGWKSLGWLWLAERTLGTGSFMGVVPRGLLANVKI